ncbi:MAG TPA: hypothetical protein PK926_17270 [Spirochaetota bacterium]|nr:hypothetical protein [Spirochaetota bacterium]HPI90805.1 hypothetical protein [Spirochaetota bacterium]HPR47614.1 hypothetical protein [Spirochaetota bacterium]
MKFESLNDLLLAIYDEIKAVNEYKDVYSIPLSDSFYEELTKKFSLIPFNIPTLIQILVSSNYIFSFDVVKEDRKNKIRRIEGYVVTKGDIISTLKRVYEDELASLYAIEFNKKLTGDRAVEMFSPHMEEYNSQPIGRIGSIAYHLTQLARVLEWDIMKYSQKRQEELLAGEIESSPPIDSFVTEQKDDVPRSGPAAPRRTETVVKKKIMDPAEYEKFLNYSSKNSFEKTIGLYGIEFYTKVCFRDYKFSLIQSHIESGVIRRKDDLVAIKKLLIKERASADKDMKIQEYAAEINRLEKVINEKLKSLEHGSQK